MSQDASLSVTEGVPRGVGGTYLSEYHLGHMVPWTHLLDNRHTTHRNLCSIRDGTSTTLLIVVIEGLIIIVRSVLRSRKPRGIEFRNILMNGGRLIQG